MKKKITSMACGIAAASIIAFALTACDDSSSSPDYNETNSSAIENNNPSSAGNEDILSSNDAPTSSEAKQDPPTSSDTPASSNNTPASSESAPESSAAIAPESSSAAEPTSSAAIASSASKKEQCIDMDQMCPPCDGPNCPVTNVPCNQCDEEGQVADGCKAGVTYVCRERLWTQIKSEPNCVRISDVDGMTANGNCNSSTDVDIVTDCATGEEYRCAANYWTRVNVCDPGSDCDGDGIPDGIRRLDLEPCNTAGSTLEFYNRYFVCNDGAWNRIDKQACEENGSTKVVGDFGFQCVSGKWEYLPPPITYINENATDVSAMGRGGPAVAPRVVKVQSASGSVTFRDDGVLVDDGCTFNGLNAELRGDTLFATILYPGCTTNSGFMGVITFTLGIDFAGVKHIKYSDRDNVKPVSEETELLPCGNTSSCVECREGTTC